MRNFFFRRALNRNAARFAAERTPLRSLPESHWLCDHACPRDDLTKDDVDTTACMWVQILALCCEDGIEIAVLEYGARIDMCVYFPGNKTGYEMVTPAASTYLTMLHDMIRMLRLSDRNPTATLRIPLARPFVQFGCLLEPRHALWIRPESHGDLIETGTVQGECEKGLSH